MKKILFVFLILFCQKVAAVHEVGGEIFLKYKGSSNQYQLGLKFYFDNNNGRLTTEASPITLGIYRKRDNQLIASYKIYKQVEENITYNNPNCTTSSQVSTRYFLYTADVTLSSSIYTDSQGYYISWATCCRNANITNVSNPNSTGATYYAEFPTLIKDGNDFIDSTPEFPVLTGDYACIYKPFSFGFGGSDADGDSLVYTLTNPLDNNASPNNTTLTYAGPYQSVTWANGYSLSQIIDASDQLKVNSKTGLVTFTASKLGLYAFSVKCAEYRNGVQIGFVQRDFQIKVIDCETNNNPVITLKDNNQTIANNSTIHVSASDSRCFNILISDKTSGTSASTSTLTVKINAVNFPTGNLSFTPTSGSVTGDNDTLRVKLCIDSCVANVNNSALQIQVITADNGCPSFTDTLNVFFDLEEKPVSSPVIITDLPNDSDSATVGNTIVFNVIATDTTNAKLTVTAIGRGFDLDKAGMEFENGKSGFGKVIDPFQWKINCSDYQLLKDHSFVIDFITTNYNCKNPYDTVTVSLFVSDTIINYKDFIPVNVFTPNGDYINDNYEMSGNAENSLNLPADNCQNKFEKIEIYNRWGKLVFTSNHSDFKWDGKDISNGLYYYHIFYTHLNYKGWVSVLK